MFPKDRDALMSFVPAKEPRYALVSSLDSIALLRRNPAELIDAVDADREVLADKSKKALGGLADLPSHAILDRGRVVGLWEYDTESQSIAWAAFTKPFLKTFHALNRNSKEGSARNISAHYDISNDLYELMLDETMMYSCAIYPNAKTSLHEAQIAKLALPHRVLPGRSRQLVTNRLAAKRKAILLVLSALAFETQG